MYVPIVPLISAVRGQNVVNMTTFSDELQLPVKSIDVLVALSVKVGTEH